MEEKKDLWELVRQKLEKEDKPESKNSNDNNILKDTDKEIEFKVKNGNKELNVSPSTKRVKDLKKIYNVNILNQGIFAGFIYILTIMLVLGMLMVPGSITAAIGGYFGGRKSGDPARALTAAMLPFLVIATISIMGTVGALPPGSGPNDLSEAISDSLGYYPDRDLLGPISKMPDSNSSVFISLVAFGFIGGLVEIDKKKRLILD